ncbi:MAG TPA: ribonuclease III [Anaerolineaceae bacterium]|nr:ribonuclease III [Anaerolineaceae bacterium]HPN52398.1 ribonuclease III [Anaerolineaceae bacterium]
METIESPEDLVRRLNLPITDILLISRAVTHRSYLNEHKEALEDNERLEFLGDAVLDFVTGAWLYHHFPEMAEGDLTRMRSALVDTPQLASFARKLELGNALRIGRGELQTGGRDRTPLLCDAFEALVGAIYLSSGIEAVEKFFHPLCEKAAIEILDSHKHEDPKGLLQEWAQAQSFQPPNYILIGDSGPDHEKVFEIEVRVNGEAIGRGFGRSKQAATKQAAMNALEHLNLLKSSSVEG